MTQDETPGGGPEPGIPRWVKVIGWVVAALVVLVIILQLTGLAGDHGPGRHFGGLAPSPSAVDGSSAGGPRW